MPASQESAQVIKLLSPEIYTLNPFAQLASFVNADHGGGRNLNLCDVIAQARAMEHLDTFACPMARHICGELRRAHG